MRQACCNPHLLEDTTGSQHEDVDTSGIQYEDMTGIQDEGEDTSGIQYEDTTGIEDEIVDMTGIQDEDEDDLHLLQDTTAFHLTVQHSDITWSTRKQTEFSGDPPGGGSTEPPLASPLAENPRTVSPRASKKTPPEGVPCCPPRVGPRTGTWLTRGHARNSELGLHEDLRGIQN